MGTITGTASRGARVWEAVDDLLTFPQNTSNEARASLGLLSNLKSSSTSFSIFGRILRYAYLSTLACVKLLLFLGKT